VNFNVEERGLKNELIGRSVRQKMQTPIKEPQFE
jgi:hypothetical protein